MYRRKNLSLIFSDQNGLFCSIKMRIILTNTLRHMSGSPGFAKPVLPIDAFQSSLACSHQIQSCW